MTYDKTGQLALATTTIYILAGGNERKYDEYGERLHRVVAEHMAAPRVLSCFFSRPENEWKDRANDWESWFYDNVPGCSQYEYATSNEFYEQIERADVIYFHGGDSWLLLDKMKNYAGLEEWFAGKVIVGSSAGANMLSKNFWSSTYAKMGQGLGLVDKNIMVHYGAQEVSGRVRDAADWERERAEFQALIDDKEITPIPEGQFIQIG